MGRIIFTNQNFLWSNQRNSRTLVGTSGGNSLYSFNSKKTYLLGRRGNDTLLNINGQNNVFKGSDGNDTINTQGGNNLIFSGYGEDQINSGGNDILIGNYQNIHSPIILNVEDPDLGNGTISGADVNTSFSSIDSFNFKGGDFDDTLVAGNGNDILKGGSGNDVLNGQGGNDIIFGNSGDDTILSSEKAFISGGKGNDLIFGRDGDFKINGDEGDDTIFMLEATGNVNGGDGFDFIAFNYQSSTSSINMTYDQNNQSGVVSFNNSRISFRSIEQLEVFGSLSDDKLVGTSSSDILNGNQGRDVLTGGLGADFFRYVNPDSGVDIITDFDVKEDKIEFISQDSLINPQFPQAGFGEFVGLSIGTLEEEQFTIGSRATNSNHRVIYNNETGDLFYDIDGVGGEEKVQLAQLSSNLELTNTNFIVS